MVTALVQFFLQQGAAPNGNPRLGILMHSAAAYSARASFIHPLNHPSSIAASGGNHPILTCLDSAGASASPLSSSNEQCPRAILTHSAAACRPPAAAAEESTLRLSSETQNSVSLWAHRKSSAAQAGSEAKMEEESEAAWEMAEKTTCREWQCVGLGVRLLCCIKGSTGGEE